MLSEAAAEAAAFFWLLLLGSWGLGGGRALLSSAVFRINGGKFLQDSLLLIREETLEAIRFHYLLPMLWIHPAEMTQCFVQCDAAVRR